MVANPSFTNLDSIISRMVEIREDGVAQAIQNEAFWYPIRKNKDIPGEVVNYLLDPAFENILSSYRGLKGSLEIFLDIVEKAFSAKSPEEFKRTLTCLSDASVKETLQAYQENRLVLGMAQALARVAFLTEDVEAVRQSATALRDYKDSDNIGGLILGITGEAAKSVNEYSKSDAANAVKKFVSQFVSHFYYTDIIHPYIALVKGHT